MANPTSPTTTLDERCLVFREHWKSLRGSGLVPTLENFLDHPEPTYAPYLFIIDVTPEGLRVRLQGTVLVERWARDYTGTILFLKKSPEFRKTSSHNFATLTAHPCALYTVDEFVSTNARLSKACTILLPLATQIGRAPTVVGYSHETEALRTDEKFIAKCNTRNATWLDLGTGIPPQPPELPSD